MLPSFATETIKFFYPRTLTARGTTELVYQTDDDNSITVSGCSIQPTTSSEALGEPRQQTLMQMTAWIPEAQWARVVAGGDIRRLVAEWRGTQFVVYGDAMRWISPTGSLGHVQIYLRVYEG